MGHVNSGDMGNACVPCSDAPPRRSTTFDGRAVDELVEVSAFPVAVLSCTTNDSLARMKDGRTHLAHKAEHAVDLETGAVVAVTVQDADEGDTTTSRETLIKAAAQVETVRPDGDGLEEVVGDKGYHRNQSLVDLEALGVRSYSSEPHRGRRNWRKSPEARDAVYRNRRRIRGPRGQRLLRLRGERLERPFAHLYETAACTFAVTPTF